MKKLILLLCIAFCLFFHCHLVFSQNKVITPLRVAWAAWYPYEYLKAPDFQSSLTGLDIELLRLIAENVPAKIDFVEMPLKESLEALKQGNVDMVLGASYSNERAQYAYYSKPYREENNALYVLREKNKAYPFHTVNEFIDYIKSHGFKLGVKSGSVLADPTLNSFVKDPKNVADIVFFTTENEALGLLLDNEIEGFVADRISGSSIIWRAGLANKLVEHTLKMKTAIHFIFSKKTVALATVKAFDKAIEENANNSAYKNNFTWYIYPVIMMQATGATWFKALDVLGAIFFSISGVLIAYSLNKSFLSALLYGVLPFMTGSILRDVIVNHRPAEAIETPHYLLLIFCVVLIGYCITTLFYELVHHKLIRKKSKIFSFIVTDARKVFAPLLIVCDALGLAALSVSGVMTSLMARAEPLWLWGPFFAFLTASFGTILRDIISKNERLEDVVGEINSEVGIIWSLFLSLALIFYANNIQADLVRNLVLITITGVFVTRLLIHYFKVPNVHF